MSEITKEEIMQDELEVRTDIEAGWQMERRNKIEKDLEEIVSFYEGRIKAAKDDAAFKIGFIDRALRGYFMTLPHKKTKTEESVTLACGKLMFKVQNPEYRRDDEKTIAWLKENDGAGYVKTEEKLDWASLKKDAKIVGSSLVDANGEVIPGVEVIEREPEFKVVPNRKKEGAENG